MKTYEYNDFLNTYFPQTKSHPYYSNIYNLICKNNILTDIYIKYSNIENDNDNIVFLQRYKWGLNKILLYLPLNDGIGINACMRYFIEQLLKFLYSICFSLSVDKINQTSYRHIKDDFKKRNKNISIKDQDLTFLYTYYANYSNDVHDKNTTTQEIGFLEEILKSDNKFIKQVNNDLFKVTSHFDKIMINLFNITIDNLSLGEAQRLQRHMNSKQYNTLVSLMNNNV